MWKEIFILMPFPGSDVAINVGESKILSKARKEYTIIWLSS